MARPTLIDERDGPCELCAAHENGKCDKCGGPIPVYENMGGSGYQSVQPSHYHQQGDKRHSFWAELCEACHKADRAENYPKEAEKEARKAAKKATKKSKK